MTIQATLKLMNELSQLIRHSSQVLKKNGTARMSQQEIGDREPHRSIEESEIVMIVIKIAAKAEPALQISEG